MSIHGAPLSGSSTWPEPAAKTPKATALTTGADFQIKHPRASPARSITDGCTEVAIGAAIVATAGAICTALPMVIKGNFLRDMVRILR